MPNRHRSNLFYIYLTAPALSRRASRYSAACMVRKERLELSRVTPLVPKTSASTNFATFAMPGPDRLPAMFLN